MSFDKMKTWALARVGEGYIYGAKGQICSPVFRRQQANQYPEWESAIMGIGAKWDGKSVWDCAQLTRYAAKQGGVSLVSGAASQWTKTDWAETGGIEALPKGSVALLYRQEKGKMQHTGIYLGDGTFVHAKGTAYGVLRQSLNEYNWTHYGILNENGEAVHMAEAAEIKYQAKVLANSLNLRGAPNTGAKRLAVIPQHAVLNVMDESESHEWLYVSTILNQRELNGWVMAKFTGKLEEDEPLTPDTTDTASGSEDMVTVMLPPAAAIALYKALKKHLGDSAL